MKREDASIFVQNCAILASLLEVSAYPKPGNVHRTSNFSNTSFEHFLSGGVAIGESMKTLAIRGYLAEEGRLNWSEISLGEYIQKAVRDSHEWQKGGNVNLGIVLLIAPISAAAGATLSKKDSIELKTLRRYIQRVLEESTPEDVISVYKTIGESMSQKNLGSTKELDILDEDSQSRIRKEGMNLIEVFRFSADRDMICSEYSSGYKTIFEVGYPYLKRKLETETTNIAIVDTFLYLLSRNPDSLIIRKSGIVKAREVSSKAGQVLETGGLSTIEGNIRVHDLDRMLQQEKGALNPGTTADLVAATIFLALLTGWRP